MVNAAASGLTEIPRFACMIPPLFRELSHKNSRCPALVQGSPATGTDEDGQPGGEPSRQYRHRQHGCRREGTFERADIRRGAKHARKSRTALIRDETQWVGSRIHGG